MSGGANAKRKESKGAGQRMVRGTTAGREKAPRRPSPSAYP